jgi:hypothetical protein
MAPKAHLKAFPMVFVRGVLVGGAERAGPPDRARGARSDASWHVRLGMSASKCTS